MRAREFVAENRVASAQEVLDYTKKKHHDFRGDREIMMYPRWQLEKIPLEDIIIADYLDSDIDLDQVDRVKINPKEKINQSPIVVDTAGAIIDGNHRAFAARELGMTHIPAWVPADSLNEDTAWTAKVQDTGKIVRIIRRQNRVEFSDQTGWLLIDTDPSRGDRGQGLKWIPDTTHFEWVRPYRDTVDENFADGKNPGRKGLSKRVGVSQKMSISQLKKIAKNSTGERRRMAQWNLNMKRGRKKSQ